MNPEPVSSRLLGGDDPYWLREQAAFLPLDHVKVLSLSTGLVILPGRWDPEGSAQDVEVYWVPAIQAYLQRKAREPDQYFATDEAYTTLTQLAEGSLKAKGRQLVNAYLHFKLEQQIYTLTLNANMLENAISTVRNMEEVKFADARLLAGVMGGTIFSRRVRSAAEHMGAARIVYRVQDKADR